MCLKLIRKITLLNRFIPSMSIIAMLIYSLAANAKCDFDVVQKGVNLAGAEFNDKKIPGVLNKDFVYPNDAEFDYFAAAGANAIRLPFLWQRIQPVLGSPLSSSELENIKTTLAKAKLRGMCVVLDVHNYGSYRGYAIGSPEVPVSAFTDLWLRLAAEFKDESVAAFGLMNEPAKLPIGLWATIAQTTVDAIRNSGAKNLILVPGGRWSGVHEWEKQIRGASNAQAFAAFRDPLKRSYIEVHQYADIGYSGTGSTCVGPETINTMFANIARWAKTYNQKLFLGEFGVPANQQCMEALNAMLAQMREHNIWGGWTYWAAGSWWGNYPMSVEPSDGRDAPQMQLLRKYLR